MSSILSYNLWHGLSPKGIFRFQEIEPRSRRIERQKMQERFLKQQNAQVIFLQEVNPVAKRSKELSESLGMSEVHHRDNSGVRWKSIGAPFNLDSGLTILMDNSQHLEWSKAVALSGGHRSIIKEKASIQWKEARYALLASTINDEAGRTLWVNTHFHHGIEMSDSLREQVSQIKGDQLISESVEEELIERMEKADQRRHQEMTELLRTIDEVKDRYNMIVVGGDFNATYQSSVMQRLVSAGFESLAERSGSTEATWDPVQNRANFLMSKDHISTLLLEDLSFDSKIVQHLEELAIQWESQPRRIDDIFIWKRQGSIDLSSYRLFGQPEDQAMAPSDHFGVRADFQWRGLA